MERMMKNEIEVRLAGVDDVELIGRLAREIWCEHYPSIISIEQIDYMLGKMYAPEVIAGEMERKGVCYWVAEREGRGLGYSAHGPTPVEGEMKLHKLYVLASCRGTGVGQRLLAEAVKWGVERRMQTLVLTVNRRNHVALAAYRRYGFAVREEVVTEFGGGFVLDDYIMFAPISTLLRTSGMVSAGSE